MTTTPKRAGDILDIANKTVNTERGTQHGGVEDSFAMIAAFWSTWLTNSNRHRHNNDIGAVAIDQVDVAQMMSLLKKARFMHGDITNIDHAVDDVGYTSIAAALVEKPNIEEGIAAALDLSLTAAAALHEKTAAARPLQRPVQMDRDNRATHDNIKAREEELAKKRAHHEAMANAAQSPTTIKFKPDGFA